MKALFITRAYSAQAGGMERLSYELINELKKNPELETQVIAKKTTGRISAILWLILKVPQIIFAAKNADVIHLGDPVLSLHGWLIQKVWKKPIAVTVHGLDVSYANPLYQLYLRSFFQNFDLYLPISNYAESILNSKFEIDNSKLRIITPGIHDRFYDPSTSRKQLDKLLGFNTEDKRILLTVGRLVKRKGHAWFIENVLPKLPENTVYVIAGRGPEEDTIRDSQSEFSKSAWRKRSERSTPPEAELARGERAADAKTSAKNPIALLGKVSDEDLTTLYNTVDAFVQPNIPVEGDAEGFGLVLTEAAACNRPVFASNLEGMTSAIHDSQNGALLPPEDSQAWISALSQIEPTSSAREYTLKNFSWSTQSQKYLAALRDIS